MISNITMIYKPTCVKWLWYKKYCRCRWRTYTVLPFKNVGMWI